MKTQKFKTNLQNIIIVSLILIAVWVGVATLSTPDNSQMSDLSIELSEEEIMDHLKQIAQKPHPVGSRESQKVREYIFTYLENLGLSPEIQEAVAHHTYKNEIITSRIFNVIVKIPGKNPTGTIALMGHYDSMPMTTGANDNTSAVITLLETARNLVSNKSLKNNVILLFTDNEEYYQLGAKAFVEQHPLAKEVSVILNFEGIGKTGPSIMFEPGPNSGWLIRRFAKSSPLPVAQSWFYDIYKNTPIHTDLDVFTENNIPGLNFMYLFEGTVYHTMLDNMHSINHQGVKHHLMNALSVIKDLDQLDLSQYVNSQSDDMIYFTLLRGILINYPSNWAIPLAIFAGILLVILGIVGLKREQITIKKTISSLLIFLLSVSLIGGIVFGLTQLIFGLYDNYDALFFGRLYNAHHYLWGFILLTIALSVMCYSYFSKKLGLNNIIMGVLVVLWIFTIFTSLLMPGMSYLFLWPLLFSLLATGWIFMKEFTDETSWKRLLIQTAGVLPAIIILVSAVIVMFHFAPNILFAVTVFLVALLLGLLIPQCLNLMKTRKYILPVVAFIASLMFFIIAHVTSGFNVERPRPNGIAYLHNLDTQEAIWFSPGAKTDEWTAQFYKEKPEIKYLGDILPLSMYYYQTIITGNAEKITLPEPQIEIVEDTLFEQNRIVRFKVKSNREAPIMTFSLKHSSTIHSVKIDNLLVDNYECTKEESLDLTYMGVQKDGFEIELEMDQDSDFEVEITDQSRTLPAELENKFSPRPNDMIPMPNFDYSTVLKKTVKF